jgi:prepilin-type N-terminal cleavage/methylation domain-containing protein
VKRLVRRLRGRGDDAGFTLVEMLTVITLLSLISALAFGALIQAQKTVRGNANRLDQAQQAKAAMETMSKTIRTAVLPSQIGGSNPDVAAFLQADWNKVSFYGNLNNQSNASGPSKVTYELKPSGQLLETIQPASGVSGSGAYTYCVVGSAGCVVYARTVARNVVYDATKPVFVYYSITAPTGMTPPLNATTLPSVNSIDLSVSVKSGKEVVASTVVTRVSLPNANAQINNAPSNT